MRHLLQALPIGGAVAAMIAALVACTSSSEHGGTGVVTGTAPLCYGPNSNMAPITTIRAVRTDGLTRTAKVRTANDHNTYRLVLPTGAYTISAYSGHIRVIVQAQKVSRHADLPPGGCL